MREIFLPLFQFSCPASSLNSLTTPTICVGIFVDSNEIFVVIILHLLPHYLSPTGNFIRRHGSVFHGRGIIALTTDFNDRNRLRSALNDFIESYVGLFPSPSANEVFCRVVHCFVFLSVLVDTHIIH